jgi:putative transcriptional regulator
MIKARKVNITKPAKGLLLLAEPFMADPNFKRSVVFLCENQKSGSVGFILNRPMPLKLSEAVEDIYNFDATLYFGGPVQTDTLHFIHNVPQLDGCIRIIDGLYWGGNFDVLKEMINSGKVKPENFRFFLGYSGWDMSQLDTELAERSWIIHPATANHIFKTKPDKLWKEVLKEMGGEYAMMVNFPEDPSLN